MAFAFVAIGIVLTWGYGGILSLGQGIFFGLGGYMMAMFLKLEASGAELPDFMVWSSVEALPSWWLAVPAPWLDDPGHRGPAGGAAPTRFRTRSSASGSAASTSRS